MNTSQICNCIKKITLLGVQLIFCGTFIQYAHADGFNANWVQLTKLVSGKYRVLIKYTHVQAGEYRDAHIDFAKKDEALDAYKKLVNGADFYLGNTNRSIHFHKPAEKNSPY